MTRNISFLKRSERSFYKLLENYYSFFVPSDSRILEIGCGTGDLLNMLKPTYGVGIDFSGNTIDKARSKYPHLLFFVQDEVKLQLKETFDYIILSDLNNFPWDVQILLENLQEVCHTRTRLIISSVNSIWKPLLKLLEITRPKSVQPNQNWLSIRDIKNILSITGFEMIRLEKKIILPFYFPLLSWLFNTVLANLPVIRFFTFTNLIIARSLREGVREYSVSIIIPARNEKGNIENAVLRTPLFGIDQELIFVEGNSIDNTFDEILRVKEQYPFKNIKVVKQSGTEKGNAVREGFDVASGDLLFILDADLTTPPEELPKFYRAISTNKGEFINGCRLVYPLEKKAMRFLNLVANRIFGLLLSYLIGQRLKDTLCGTKVMFRKDYEIVSANRHSFGTFDPFGDFDMLFGAAKQNLKIAEVPVRYKGRQYGNIQINRFKSGWLLLKMTLKTAKKLKFF